MQRYKRLGLFLHNSPSDAAAIEYAGKLAGVAQSQSLLCVHVREPADASEADPGLAAFQAEVRRQLPQPVAQLAEFEVHPGTGVPEILRSARDRDLDMVIVGRRLPSDHLGIGSAFARLARKAPCDVLVVPRDARPHCDRVFVPVDFSRHSKRALALAVALAKAGGGEHPQVVVHTNSPVGYGYKKLGLSLEQAIAEREKLVRGQLEQFVSAVDTSGVETELVPTTADDTETSILETAAVRKMDMIVIGSRGESSIFLLGSTSEHVVHHSLLPVLVAKEKGETVAILEALFR